MGKENGRRKEEVGEREGGSTKWERRREVGSSEGGRRKEGERKDLNLPRIGRMKAEVNKRQMKDKERRKKGQSLARKENVEGETTERRDEKERTDGGKEERKYR